MTKYKIIYFFINILLLVSFVGITAWFLFFSPCWIYTFTQVPGRCVAYFAERNK